VVSLVDSRLPAGHSPTHRRVPPVVDDGAALGFVAPEIVSSAEPRPGS